MKKQTFTIESKKGTSASELLGCLEEGNSKEGWKVAEIGETKIIRSHEELITIFGEKINDICAKCKKPDSFDEWYYLGSFDIDLLEGMISLIKKHGRPINNQISVFTGKNKLAPLVAAYKDGDFVMCAPRHNPSWCATEEREERPIREFMENIMR